MLGFWDHHGILGINARNLLYIKKENPASGIAFADDKLRTKQYLSARGIKTAKILAKISNEQELQKFRFESIPQECVLKPNSGYGGQGIWVITGKRGDRFETADGKTISQQEIEDHVSDILEGRYSITGSRDKAFFEERLISHPNMGIMGRFGLPDIRIIVFNLIPVMAMLRVPTRESRGKANLNMGGLGLGIDIAKGITTHTTYHYRLLDSHPDFETLKGFKIPFWENILLLSSRIQEKVTLGYLAVDIVVDKDRGPTLLEINARAGLSVQTANLAPLRERLDRVSGITVQTPEKGVRIAQDLFGKKMERKVAVSSKKIVGLSEDIILHLENNASMPLKAMMNPMRQKHYLKTSIFESLGGAGKESMTLNFTLQGERGKGIFFPKMLDQDVLLGKAALQNFYLDVNKGQRRISPLPKPGVKKEPWQETDEKLCEIDRRISLLGALKPLDLESHFQRFLRDSSYQPVFRYAAVKTDLLKVQSELNSLVIPSEAPFETLFQVKKEELLEKLDLISVIGDDLYFPLHSSRILQEIPPEVQELSVSIPQEIVSDEHVSSETMVDALNASLRERNLLNWTAVEKSDLLSRCMISKKKMILVRKGEWFSTHDFQKLMAHEIETHIYCQENGAFQPLQLLSRGTANYLKTQEGLAVWQQTEYHPRHLRMAVLGFRAVMLGTKQSFRQIYEWLREHLSEKEAWNLTVKVKRGLSHTKEPGAFYKNALYLWGYYEIKNFLQGGGTLQDLFLGKFALKDLPLIKSIPGIVKAKYLPSQMHASSLQASHSSSGELRD